MGFVGLSVNMDLNTELWAVGALWKERMENGGEGEKGDSDMVSSMVCR
jgi:hypothetical protein